ncbi:DMT family transporter [Bacillus cereus]|uniref:DMT family transporter n=1 Tax=Bacillus TaxID=1386 RepID=UPI000555387D|nr:DMT family transporter [Bacillus sp. UNC322MFChir4.1]
MRKQITAYISLALAMSIVGSSIVVGKLMVQSIPVFLSSGLRFGLASIILITLLFVFEKGFPTITRKDLCILIIQSFAGVFLFSICLLYGVQFTTGTESGIITSTTPMAIGILSVILLKEKISKNVVIGLLLAVLGLISINLFGEGNTLEGRFPLLGNSLIIVAVIGEALFAILAKLLSPNITPLAISTFVTLIGFVFFLPFSIYEGINFDFTYPTLLEWSYVLYYAIVVTVLAFYLWYNGVLKVPASISAVFTAVIPVVTIILSYIILQEKITLAHFIGISLVITGIFASVIMKPKDLPTSNNFTDVNL